MVLELSCKCGHNWTYKGRSEHYATCPRCHNLVNVNKARISKDTKPADDLESAVNPLTERLYINRTEFERSVDTTYRLINELKITEETEGLSLSADDVTRFFVLKAAYERAQNKIANEINKCYKCCFLKGPLPTYPEQDSFAIMDKLHNRVLYPR